jgi:hypothetical protein
MLLQGPSLNWPTYQLWGGAFSVNQPGTQIAGYEKRSQRSFGGRADLTAQLKQHEVKFGGEYTQYTIREYNPTGVFQWYKLQQTYSDPATLELALQKLQGTGTNSYGYDVFGNQIEATSSATALSGISGRGSLCLPPRMSRTRSSCRTSY